jgi:hypothetical protein
MKDEPLWTLKDGIIFCREIEKYLNLVGYHCALTGGVLYNRKSFKDLDVMIYPHSHKTFDFDVAVETLKVECKIDKLEKIIPKSKSYADCKDIWIGEFGGKRIDFFFVR